MAFPIEMNVPPDPVAIGLSNRVKKLTPKMGRLSESLPSKAQQPWQRSSFQTTGKSNMAQLFYWRARAVPRDLKTHADDLKKRFSRRHICQT
jgi:hypothetical protein